jgi:DNA-binding MarR family transcriptional regulator
MARAAVTETISPDGAEAGAALARLEVGLSAYVRWMEGRHARGEIARRTGHSLTRHAVDVLEQLDGIDGPLRVSDIAECNAVDTSTMTVRLQGLDRQGLVERTADPLDRRSALISISPAGEAAVREIRAVRQDLLRTVLGDADADELQRAADLMGRVSDHVLSAYPAPG